MTASEIESIMKIQLSGLFSKRPFLEDYYFESKFLRDHPNVIPRPHFPIAGGQINQEKKKKDDPFRNALGQVISSSSRAPRASLAILKGDIQTMDAEKLMKKKSTPERALLLHIENVWSVLLEVEDIDLLLRTKAPQRDKKIPTVQELIEMRQKLIRKSFDLLYVKGEGEESGEKKDERRMTDAFFLKFVMQGKGMKLLGRFLPLFFPPQIHLISLALMRNLLLLVISPTNEEEDGCMKRIFGTIISVLSSFPPAQSIQAFHALFSSHTQTQVFQIAKTKIGIVCLGIWLKRRLDLMQGGVRIQDWEELFSKIWQIVGGRVRSLFAKDISNEYSNNAESNQVWEFLLILAWNCGDGEKRLMREELREVIKGIEINEKIRSLLQVLSS